MLNGKKILAVIPARGGSKGIRGKNLRPVCGVPLVAKVGEVTKELSELDRVVVSTDSDKIAAIAEAAGIAAPFRRPEYLSGDRVGDLEVLTHALKVTEELDRSVYDVVVMLQPTSPLRTSQHVRDCINKLVFGSFDSVWTVSETDSKNHPFKQLNVNQDGELSYYDRRGREIIARQQLEPLYHRNGIAYAITRDCLVDQQSIMGKKAGALVVSGVHVSIDTIWDLDLVEFIMSSRKPHLE